MKKIIYGLFATITGVVLLMSYRTSLDAVAPTASSEDASGSASTSSGSGSSAAGSTSSDATPTSSPTPSSTSTTSTGLKDGTFTGQSIDTRYGPVQTQITVSGGKITKVEVPVYPTNSFRDQEINRQAVPELVSETLDAQSSTIDMVSGATYTSEGYLQSLQNALDEARA
jgi:uncharacterized protein with FMN-binding domain